MKINRNEENAEVKRIEGYVDKERNVFVVTGDPHNLLTKNETPIKNDDILVDVKEFLKKYKPNFTK